MWNWLNTNAGALSLLLAVVLTMGPLVFSAWRYLSLRADELRFRRFEIYHNLIRQLVAPEPGYQTPYLDRQIAAIYELRNFPEYYELSIRLLRGLKQTWANNPHPRLLEEVDHSMVYMNQKMKPRNRIELSNK